MSERIGFVVAVEEVDGTWAIDWDGALHPTFQAAVESTESGNSGGWTFRICGVWG